MEPLQTDLDYNTIQLTAYHLWQQRGCVLWEPEDDWFRAEEQLREQTQDVSKRPPVVAVAEVMGSMLGSVAGFAASVGNLIRSDEASVSE